MEEEFSKRDKTINLMNLMVKKRLDAAEEENEEKSEDSKVKSKAGDRLVSIDLFLMSSCMSTR